MNNVPLDLKAIGGSDLASNFFRASVRVKII